MNDDEYGSADDSNLFEEESFTEQYQNYLVFSNAVLIIELLLAVIGVVANCTVCGVLLRKKRLLKNFSTFHLFNLAITDIIFRLALTPVLLTIENTAVKHGSNTVCKLGAFGSYTTLAVTFTLLLGIAFDRYVHIVHPIRARSITWKHSRSVVVISWLYSAACSSPFLYSMKYVKADWNLTANTEYELCLSTLGLPFQISSSVFLVFAFLVPLILMAVAYGKILKVLWERARSKVINSKIAEAKFRAVKMMIVIVVAYFISWGPKLIWTCLQAFEIISLEYPVDWDSYEISWEEYLRQEKKYIILLIVDDTADLFTFTSSILNPVIFGYYNMSFREDLKKCCCRRDCFKCFQKCNRKTKTRNKTEKQNVFVLDTRTKTTENIALGDRVKTFENVCALEDEANEGDNVTKL
ncbi:C-C chemokine receptor type 1-like [Oculina patagonica]